MNNEIFIEADKSVTLEIHIPVVSQVISVIGEIAEGIDEIDEPFSVADLADLLNKISTNMSGAFEIRRTPSDYCQIIYEPNVPNESEFDEENYTQSETVDIDDGLPICLWINEKVLRVFVEKKLYGTVLALYFYLGYLMTRSERFAVSHNISFEEIVESFDVFLEGHLVKHRTTLMRAIADLQDAELIKWNAEAGTFELLHITSYDPTQKV